MAKFISVTKSIFFDRDRIIRATDQKERKVLALTGGFGRQVMKRGMRRRKSISPPGGYPHAHAGQLRNLIYFGYDLPSGSLVIGPTLFASKSGSGSSKTVPELLNEGGAAVRSGTRRLHFRGKTRVVSTGSQIVRYRPRPFVALSLPPTLAAFRRNMETVPFR